MPVALAVAVKKPSKVHLRRKPWRGHEASVHDEKQLGGEDGVGAANHATTKCITVADSSSSAAGPVRASACR